jgi:hypothetical protein
MPRNLIGGIATILIGLAYLAMTFQIRASALDDSVGPAGFPKALAFMLTGLGLILCVQSLWALRARRLAAAPTPADASGGEGRGGAQGMLRAAGMLALGIAYLLILRRLGYVPSIALLIIAAALYLGTPFSWRVVAIGVAGAVVYWVVFVRVLGIPQPPGLLAIFT